MIAAPGVLYNRSKGLDSRPGLLSAGVTFFRGNDVEAVERSWLETTRIPLAC